MIQTLLNKGKYTFKGSLVDLRRCINSLKIIEVIQDTHFDNAYMYTVLAQFKYHGGKHKVLIERSMTGEEIFYLKYEGTIGGV